MTLDSPRDRLRTIEPLLSGNDVIRLMRKFRVTIRDLSLRTGITQKRIRQVRSAGLDSRNAVRDWIEAITGKDPGPVS